MQTYCRQDAARILDEIGRIGLDNCINLIATRHELSDKFLMETGHLLDIFTLSGIIPMDVCVYDKYIKRLNWHGVTKKIILDTDGINFIVRNIDNFNTDILDRFLELDTFDCKVLSIIVNYFMGKNMMTRECWKIVSEYTFLDEIFLRDYNQYLHWCEVSQNNKNIPVDLILENVDDVHWKNIWYNYKFKEEDLIIIINKLLGKGFNVDGAIISSTQVLSEKFMDDFQDILNWTNISEYQKMSYEFLLNHLELINLFHLDKNCVTDREIIDRFLYERHGHDAYDATWTDF